MKQGRDGSIGWPLASWQERYPRSCWYVFERDAAAPFESGASSLGRLIAVVTLPLWPRWVFDKEKLSVIELSVIKLSVSLNLTEGRLTCGELRATTDMTRREGNKTTLRLGWKRVINQSEDIPLCVRHMGLGGAGLMVSLSWPTSQITVACVAELSFYLWFSNSSLTVGLYCVVSYCSYLFMYLLFMCLFIMYVWGVMGIDWLVAVQI